MNLPEQMVDRRVLEQLSGAETATHKVTVRLPRFEQVDVIDRPVVTVSYVRYELGKLSDDYSPFDPFDDSDEGGGYMVTCNRILSPRETAAYFEDGTIPEDHSLVKVVTEYPSVFVDLEQRIVYFTGEGLSLGAMRVAIRRGMGLGSSGYNSNSTSGQYKTGAAVAYIKRSVADELQLGKESRVPDPSVVDSQNSYCVPRGESWSINGRGTRLYLERKPLTQGEIDDEIEKQNVPGLQEAREQRLPDNIRVYHRVGGRTGCSTAWVIRPDGSLREPDDIIGDPRRIARYGEGTYLWRQILPGEAVLRWGKSNTAAEHIFDVLYEPETLTPEQLEIIAGLENKIADEWEGRKGLSSGIPSPDIGAGWGLLSDSMLHNKPDYEGFVGDFVDDDRPIGEVTPEMLETLRQHFNK